MILYYSIILPPYSLRKHICKGEVGLHYTNRVSRFINAIFFKIRGYKTRDPVFISFFLFGLAGNHPFRTRSFCWNSSRMLQKDENANTPVSDDNKMFDKRTDAAIPPIPASRNIHQQRVPQ